MADAPDSGSGALRGVRVQLPPSAPSSFFFSHQPLTIPPIAPLSLHFNSHCYRFRISKISQAKNPSIEQQALLNTSFLRQATPSTCLTICLYTSSPRPSMEISTQTTAHDCHSSLIFPECRLTGSTALEGSRHKISQQHCYQSETDLIRIQHHAHPAMA